MRDPHGKQRICRAHVQLSAHGKRILHHDEKLAALALPHFIGTSDHNACVADFNRHLHDDASLQGWGACEQAPRFVLIRP